MKHSTIRDWLIDVVVILGLSAIAIFVLPMVSALCAMVLSHVSRSLFWMMVARHLVSGLIVGPLLGIIAAAALKHRMLSLTSLPAVLVCLFYVSFICFGPDPYDWGESWHDFVIVGGWLLLVASSLFCSWVVMKKRLPPVRVHPARAK